MCDDQIDNSGENANLFESEFQLLVCAMAVGALPEDQAQWDQWCLSGADHSIREVLDYFDGSLTVLSDDLCRSLVLPIGANYGTAARHIEKVSVRFTSMSDEEKRLYGACSVNDFESERCLAGLRAALAEMEDPLPTTRTRKVAIDLIGHQLVSRRMVLEVPMSWSDQDILQLTAEELHVLSDVIWKLEDHNVVAHRFRIVGEAPADSDADVLACGEPPEIRRQERPPGKSAMIASTKVSQ